MTEGNQATSPCQSLQLTGSSLFSLRKSHAPPTAPSISVDFSLSALNKNNELTSINLIPNFNNDKKYYTPAFILPPD